MGFDLEFASGQGFADFSEHDAAPTLQLAVIYTTVVRATASRAACTTGATGITAAAAAGDAGDTGGASAAEGWVVARRCVLCRRGASGRQLLSYDHSHGAEGAGRGPAKGSSTSSSLELSGRAC